MKKFSLLCSIVALLIVLSACNIDRFSFSIDPSIDIHDLSDNDKDGAETLQSKYGDEAYEKAKSINSTILNDEMSDIEKIRTIHDYIVDNVKYDHTLSKHSAYDALIGGVSVCQGYAESFQLMMELAGLPCEFVAGDADNGSGWQPHAWNAVKMDGLWYYVDTTWDDPITEDGKDIKKYTYFMTTYDLISKHHSTEQTFENGTSTEYRDWALGLEFDTHLNKTKNAGYYIVQIQDVNELAKYYDKIFSTKKICIYCPALIYDDVGVALEEVDLAKYRVSKWSMSGEYVSELCACYLTVEYR